jgi:hypothetical protein
MEIFILILSSLISVISPANFAGDKVIASNVRSQFKQVEQLQVRLDNAPTFNIIKGKVDKLRIAGRGFYPLEDIRIDTIELETDPINVSLADLRQRRYVLQEPLGVAIKVVFKEEDALRALTSPTVTRTVQQLLRGLNRNKQLTDGTTAIAPASTVAQGRIREEIQNIRQTVDNFRITNPRVEFLDNRRIQLQADVQDLTTGDVLKLAIETGIDILEGRQFRLITPTVTVNGQPVPEEFVRGFAENIAKELDLGRLEKLLQVRARVFYVRFANNGLEIAAFVGLPAGFRI